MCCLIKEVSIERHLHENVAGDSVVENLNNITIKHFDSKVILCPPVLWHRGPIEIA